MAEKTLMETLDEALAPTITEDAPASEESDESASTDTSPERTESDESGADSDGDSDGDADSDDKAEGDGEAAPEGEQPEVDPKTGKPVEKGPNGERERNPDGTWKKAEAKKPDPVNDPIPKELKQETRARMQTLVDTVKQKDTELATVKENFDYIVNGIQATGATPEQYGEALSWLKLFNSGNPEHQAKALELVEGVAERLATLLGKERTINDPLKAHADLQEAVRTGKLTAEYAKEIARTRNGQQFRTELTTTAQTRQQQIDQAKQVETQARADLTSLEETLRAMDGKEYDAIKDTIVPILKPVMAALNPSQWKQKFSEAYKAEKDRRAAARTAAVAKPRVPSSQPLRAGKNPAGGQARQPSSAGEALNAALASMTK